MKLSRQEYLNTEYFKMQKKDTLKQFFPKKYNTPHGYLNPSYLQSHYMFKFNRYSEEKGIVDFLRNPDDLVNNTALLRQYVINDFVKEEWPIFFVKQNFLKAVQNTNPPDFNLHDLKLPRNPMIFVFPFGELKIEDKNVPFITFAKVEKTFFVSIWFCDHEIFYMELDNVWNLSSYNELARERLLGESTSKAYKYTTKEAENWVDKNQDEIKDLGLLVFNILLILNSRPKLISSENDIPKNLQIPNQKIKIKPYATPLWIGLDYKIIKESVGSHASPTIHWRRGHIRNQAFGQNHSQHRIIWIEPTIVGA